MRSDANSFGKDVVLKRALNMASTYADSILDQIYEKQIFLDFCYEDFNFQKLMKKIYI